MFTYRIAKNRYIHDLSGAGAKLNGGRWNHKGINVLYTSSSRALAAVEYLVHVSITMVPKNLSIATFKIPDDAASEHIEVMELPKNWRDYPAPPELVDIGNNWASKNNSLILRVPSVVIDREFNILINPSHPDISRVEIVDIQPYVFNGRLLR